MSKAIEAMTEDMRNKVRLMVGRGLLTLVNDGGAIQVAQVQLLDEETADDVERVQEYGFSSVPQSGAEAAIVFVGGNRDHGLIIAVEDRRYRLKGLKAGEVALYDDLGQKIHLTRNGIVIDGAGKPIEVRNTPSVFFDTPAVHASGDMFVDGSIVAGGDVSDRGNKSMAGMRNTYNDHDHSNPEGGVVGKPNGRM